MNEPTAPRFEHPENITVGLARVIYAPFNRGWSETSGFHLPGGKFTTSRDIAHTVAVRMNAAMGGVQVMRGGV